jgi:glutaconate CoA-transferase subunit B
VGFLGAAQIDRFGNLNSTVIGDYDHPKTRLPGAGGAPEIATHARRTFIVLRMSPRSFVPQIAFRSSGGFFEGGDSRERAGAPGAGPEVVITDYGILRPHPVTRELQLSGIYPGVDPAAAQAACGWPLAIADTLEQIAPPSLEHLEALRALHARTDRAHSTLHPFPL